MIVVKDICRQLVDVSEASTSSAIQGVMIESHLVAGRQNLTENPAELVYGQSITDACIGWEDTVKVLDELREAVQSRRAQKTAQGFS